MANAEQLSFLFFFYLIEGIDAENAARAKVLKQQYESVFAGDWELKNPLNALAKGQTVIPRERFRWSVWARGLSGEALVRFVQDEVFAFFEEAADRVRDELSAGRPAQHHRAYGAHAGRDAGGWLSSSTRRTRTPRATSSSMCSSRSSRRVSWASSGRPGTSFAPSSSSSIRRSARRSMTRRPARPGSWSRRTTTCVSRIRRPPGITEVELDGKIQRRGIGDKLSAAKTTQLQNQTFYGNDVDPQMVRLATMNLTLRGLPNVRILLRNVLTTTLDPERREALQLPEEGYHVILANPPFAGRVDSDRVVDDVKVGNTKATEVLFLKYMMESLRPGGRCGVIVPEGLLFGSTGAHKEIRRQLIENNRVEAVMSLPGGVFQPYSGVKTSVLFFRKGGSTERVLFLHVDNDGYKLDANHDAPIAEDDLPELAAAYREREARAQDWAQRDPKAPWHPKWWFAEAADLKANEFNLSAADTGRSMRPRRCTGIRASCSMSSRSWSGRFRPRWRR
jgi:type I restriction enzyme M protein